MPDQPRQRIQRRQQHPPLPQPRHRPVEDCLATLTGRPRPPIHPPRQLVGNLRELLPPVRSLDLPPMLEPGHLPHHVVPHHRRPANLQLPCQVLHHRLQHIERVVQERPQVPHRGQLQREPQPIRRPTTLTDQLPVDVVQEEEPLQILDHRRPHETPVRLNLASGKKSTLVIILGHRWSTYGSPNLITIAGPQRRFACTLTSLSASLRKITSQGPKLRVGL
jgi:hypothetical protein